MAEVYSPNIERVISGLTQEVLTLLAIKKRGEATELLVEKIERDNFIYTTRNDNKSEMWIYKEGIYIPQGKSFIKEFCRRILGQAFNNHICNEVISKIEADTFIESEKFFGGNSILPEIPIKNGIFNLITHKLKPFNPQKIFFNKLPVTYDENAECPIIDKHFKDVLSSEDDIEVMYEIFGFLLWKDYFIEKAIMMVGNGRNGKGKTIDLMKRFLGIDNCSSVPLSSLNDGSFRVSELFGKLANLSGDLSHTALKETGMFKELTARDLIGANRKFLTDINFINYSKLVFACNELPRVYDYSDGFWERWILFEFPYKFLPKEEFDNLKEEDKKNNKLMDTSQIDKMSTQEELNGLFIKSLEGLKRILKNKNFSYSKGTEEIKKLWIKKADSFMAFALDNLEQDYSKNIPKHIIRLEFSKYCKRNKLRGVSDKNIKIVLEELFGASDIQAGIDDRTRIWLGIKFKEESMCNYANGKLSSQDSQDI